MTAEERLKILQEAKPDTWIAFSADESAVVACAETYSRVVELAEAKGEENPVIFMTPEDWSPKVYLPAH